MRMSEINRIILLNSTIYVYYISSVILFSFEEIYINLLNMKLQVYYNHKFRNDQLAWLHYA